MSAVRALKPTSYGQSVDRLYPFVIAAVGGPDTTPDAFSFTDQTNVARSTVITSAPITVAGIDAPANISVTGGEYSINGGAFTSSPGVGTVVNGDQIRARNTSSGSYSTAVNTAVTIGGVSDTFTSTTLAGATTPDVNDPGTAEAVAISTIEGAGLVALVQRAYSVSVPEGEVISQSPAPGTLVDSGSTVTIVVSRGVVPASTSNGNVTGMFGIGRMMVN